MPTHKRPPACQTCGNAGKECKALKASQRDRFPRATKKCTGYKRAGDIPLVPPSTIFVLARRDRRTVVVYGLLPVLGDENRPLPCPNRHSPDGFEMGYEGSGPADTALAILTAVLGEGLADTFYQDYKRKVIAKMPPPPDDAVVATTAKSVMEYFRKASQHEWVRRKAKRAFERCAKCGASRRPDGKDGYCLAPR